MKTISVIFSLWVIVISLISILHVDFPYRRPLLWVSIAIVVISELYRFLKPKIKSED
jgi:predicted MFS family arabinose efflux permease